MTPEPSTADPEVVALRAELREVQARLERVEAKLQRLSVQREADDPAIGYARDRSKDLQYRFIGGALLVLVLAALFSR